MGGNISGYGPAAGGISVDGWSVFGWGDYLAVLCQYTLGGGGLVMVYDPEAGGAWRELTHVPTAHPDNGDITLEPWGAGSWGGKLVVICQKTNFGPGSVVFTYNEETRSWDLIEPDVPGTA